MPVLPRYDVLTLHPDLVRGPLTHSMLGRASAKGVIDVRIFDIRDHAEGRHREVDDAPYGGGAGMVMRVDVVAKAVEAAAGDTGHVIHLTPAGRPLNQAMARRLAELPHLVLLCGHYEGIDDRIHHVVDEEISLGDFVLTGGELAACAVVDAVARLQPGVLGNADSAVEESFSEPLLEHPQFTRPREWRGHEVPAVLLSGHHAKVEAWRKEQALARTKLRRPDLLASPKEGADVAAGVDGTGSKR
ncbi:MAG: tRNA (guanosine(37)-N1)-methyltransferase TrmD [Myxococcota bacterium]